MSGKGSGGKPADSGNNKPGSSSKNEDKPPEVVSGWHYHQYAQSSPDRYVYIGKDDDGEPEFLDYGPKSARR